MSEPPPPAPPSGAHAHPVDVSERVILMDVLRGFALCGVFVSNSFSWFSGRVLLPRDQVQALSAPALEAVVTALDNFFVNQLENDAEKSLELDDTALGGRLCYVLAHGVKEGLVEKCAQWPGLT